MHRLVERIDFWLFSNWTIGYYLWSFLRGIYIVVVKLPIFCIQMGCYVPYLYLRWRKAPPKDDGQKNYLGFR